jgi:putative transposase
MHKKEYTPEYKAKIVLEVLKEEKTASEIASREAINVKQLYNWRKEFLENAQWAFSVTKDEKIAKNSVKELKEREQVLMTKVGQLTVEVDWLKKNIAKLMEGSGIRDLVSKDDVLSIKRQCEFLGINRTSFYYEPKLETPAEKEGLEILMAKIDFWHTHQCYLGARRLKKKLWKEDKILISRKKIKRLMREMGICAVYPKPNLSKASKHHKKFPYLLKNMNIFLSNQVWAIDITYIKMGRTHMYLTAIIDWHSRFVVGWALSETLDTVPVLQALKEAISKYGVPAIINSDQGSQFTSDEYIAFLKGEKIRQSMDGKARWVDNVIIERWFRSLKCENIYINEYQSPKALRNGIKSYINEYNNERPHQSLENQYPCEVYALEFAS